MEDDFVLGLTKAVKQEVVENYLLNRRVVEEVLQEFHERTERAKKYRTLVGKRFLRMFGLLIDPSYIKEFINIIGVERIRPFEFFGSDLDMRRIRLISAGGFTFRAKYRRIVLESYDRLVMWAGRYKELYYELCEDCKAANANVDWFRKEFDLLSIIHFLKNMDVLQLERQKFLGGNFTPEELMSVESKMIIRPVVWESLDLPKPLELPDTKEVRKSLLALIDRVYDGYQAKLRAKIK